MKKLELSKKLGARLLKLKTAIFNNYAALDFDPDYKNEKEIAENITNVFNNCLYIKKDKVAIQDLFKIGITIKEANEHSDLWDNHTKEYIKLVTLLLKAKM